MLHPTVRNCALVSIAIAKLLSAQSMGSSGSIVGKVTDPSGAIVAGAAVSIENPVSHYKNQTTSDTTGTYKFNNIPFSHYHISVSKAGFQTTAADTELRTSVPVTVDVALTLGLSEASVTVIADAGDLVESVPTAHTDIDEKQFTQLPITSTSAGLSDVITMSAPGVVADSNGMFHPLGDHGQTSYMVDNQPISDQQSKQFSTQLPENAVQSLEIIEGAPLAEYGDKTSLVVNTVTKSGLGQKPNGSFSTYIGSFGTYGENATFGVGNQKFGNFLAANTSRTGRFLDSPEFAPNHDIGNSMQFFDRLDYQPDANDTLHLNLGLARNWFQIPNTYDQGFAGQDQRQRVVSWNVAPGYVHLFGSAVALTVSPWYRQDQVSYYPSRDVLSDQPVSIGQSRRLGSGGVRGDLSYVHGIHNIKVGGQISETFLREFFQLGITDPTFNPPCLTSSGSAYLGTASCTSPGLLPNPDFLPGLYPYDLTRGGQQFVFTGRTDIRQYAAYIQDQIKFHGLSVNIGLRYDVYHGLVSNSSAQPRFGVSYEFKPTHTVARISYSRSFETPYNENLILSSSTGSGGLANVFGASAAAPLKVGNRDEYGAGLQQGAGRHLVISADYFWKYTHNAYDFDTLLNTPIAFPISWRESKIDGVSARISVPETHGFSAFVTLGHTRARFFGPEEGGLIFNSSVQDSVFRIDHDQQFQQTTYLRYQFAKHGPWLAFTWRFDSGEVAGDVQSLADVLTLTADEQQQIGASCAGVPATLFRPITSCAPGQLQVSRISIPAVYNADHSPTRIAARN
ncbi:MAG TPA: TonB-dependent receptor, partial [Bryobacteraceae bacterium]